MIRRLIPCIVAILSLCGGCVTYFQRNQQFQEFFVTGNFPEAYITLEKNKWAATGKDRLLNFLQKGVVLQMMDRFEESNRFFEDAYLYVEDLQRNFAAEAFSLLTNPQILPYRGEDFEEVQIHYYKALNYLRTNALEEALVECRRLNIKLNQINDKYDQRKNRYRTDAFALNLMGIIYDVSGDYNNAFIAYRNAYEAYSGDYKDFFRIEAPLQLKTDLLRSAYLSGFSEELELYERELGMKYRHKTSDGGELVFFWNNGLGPVKDEWSINFFLVRGKGGAVFFVNEELGLTFPFVISGGSKDSTGLGDLHVVRVAFPRYLERKPYYRGADLTVGGRKKGLELGQNINAIAFKSLEDRMLRELSTSLLRLASKQASEQMVRKQNKNLGALLSIANALSEKADTRNWQTLPYGIYYARVQMPAGRNEVEFTAYSQHNGLAHTQRLLFEIPRGRTVFYLHHTLDSLPLSP